MIPTAAQATVSLSDRDAESFHRQGFVAIEELTGQDEVEQLRGIYDRLFTADSQVPAHDRVELAGDRDADALLPQILNPDHHAPELLETTAYANAAAIAAQLLGDEVEYMGMHAIRKPPRAGAETPWHQDEAYWDPSFDHPALSIWMPLQPATLDNGCMQFVPGTHLQEVVEHELISSTADGLQMVERDSVEGAVACPLPPGGATVHAGRTLHYAGPNFTDEPRRALIMAFRTTPTWRGDGREFGWQPRSWYE